MPRLVLNALAVSFGPDLIDVREKPFHSTKEVRELRRSFGDDWFFYYKGEHTYALPRRGEPTSTFGEPGTLRIAEHLQLARLLLEDALPAVFKDYKPLYLRPLAIPWPRADQDRVAAAASKLGLRHPLLSHFTVRSKLEIAPRLLSPEEGVTKVAVFLELSSRWEISAPLADLVAKGVDLRGLCVVRPEPGPEERRLVGRLARLEGDKAVLAESFDGTESLPAERVRLEGRKEAFARCLTALLGKESWSSLEEELRTRSDWEGTGPRLLERYKPIASFLRNQSPIQLPGGIVANVGNPIEIPLGAGTAVAIPPIEYCFDAAKEKRDMDNWRGLRRFGPFSRDTIRQRSPRVLVLCDETVKSRVEQLIRKLRDGIPSSRQVFDAGFQTIFHLADVRFEVVALSLSDARPEQIAARFRDEAIKALHKSTLPAAAIVIVDDKVAELPDKSNPYLFARSGLMMAGVPVQALRASRVSWPDNRVQYVLQNLAIALYAKLEGTPWTVVHDPTLTDELVIGLGTAELTGSRFEERQRVVGVTTVFRGDGNYLVGNLSRECPYAEYPEVLKQTTLDVLQDIRRRNGWQPGDRIRIVFHSWKPLKHVEVAEIVSEATRAAGDGLDLEFAVLTVSHDHPMRVLDLEERGWAKGEGSRRGVNAPKRGMILRVREDEHLVCVQGPELMKRPSQPLPDPLLVRLHRGHGLKRTDLWYLSEQVLKFTSLSWKSRLPAPMPATIYYSKLIAEQLGRLRAVPDWSPLTLNQMLPVSKWFL